MSGRGGEGSQRRTVGDRAQQSDAVIEHDPRPHPQAAGAEELLVKRFRSGPRTALSGGRAQQARR
jgi:hypothetical protein